MAEQRLRAYQAFVGGLVDRDSDEETLRRGLRPRTRNLLQRKFALRPDTSTHLQRVTVEIDGTAARDTPNRAARAASISNFRFVAASTSASTFWAVR